MKLPAQYTEAKRALAACVRKDEVKDIRDKAMAMEVYAYQANDAELVGYAAEMRKRSERRIGELIEDDRKAGKLAKGARGNPKGRGAKIVRVDSGPAHQSLADQGVDKHLADRARKAAAMSEEKFEAAVVKTIKIAVAAVKNTTEVIKAAREESHKAKRAKRAKRESALAMKIMALPQKRYGVILADPEWKFEFWSALGMTNSSADNHYTTSVLEVIKARDVPSISADDCILLLWATVPMLPQALEVMVAWGFAYVSHFCWAKNKAGTGYWNRNKHELLLIGTRGKVPAPAPGDQWDSIIEAAVGKHSAKPERFLELVEAYFPNLPKIELNRRGPARPGWDAWGNEAQEPTEDAA